MLTCSVPNARAFRLRMLPPLILFFVMVLLQGHGLAASAELLKISGKVMDAGGAPVAGAQVYVYESANIKRPADYMSNRTQADGVYEVKVPAGRYWLVAMMRKSGSAYGPLGLEDRHSGEPAALEVKAGGLSGQDFTVLGLREAARLHQKENTDLVKVRGVIVDADGKPVANATVLADPAGRPGGVPKFLSAWSDAEGRFLLYVPRGKLFLGATRIFPPPGNETVLPDEYQFTGERSDLRVSVGRD